MTVKVVTESKTELVKVALRGNSSCTKISGFGDLSLPQPYVDELLKRSRPAMDAAFALYADDAAEWAEETHLAAFQSWPQS